MMAQDEGELIHERRKSLKIKKMEEIVHTKIEKFQNKHVKLAQMVEQLLWKFSTQQGQV